MKRKKKNYTIVYRLKWTAWEYRVAIAAVNDYRLKLKSRGLTELPSTTFYSS